MTDMTHDDGNSLIRYLYYAHQFDTEAIIVTPQLPDYTHNDSTPWNKAQSVLSAYKEEYEQISRHHPDYPTYEELKVITKQGRGALPIIWLTNEKKFKGDIAGRHVESTWGDIQFSDWIGEGKNRHGEPKDSEGSEFLQQVFAKKDDRPIFVQMWGGPITFIQALYRYKQRNGKTEWGELLQKLHVYGILLQDITFDYLIDIDKVKSINCGNIGSARSTYHGERAHPKWLLHDGGHFWKYCCDSDPTFEKPMLPVEVNGHGPLSDLYDHGGEGDTPSFLYLLSAGLGLNDPLKPSMGSWGSMFQPMGEEFPNGYYHTCGVDVYQLTRWIKPVKNSFLNRLNYTVLDPENVNHEPVASINGKHGNEIMYMSKPSGTTIRLDASQSSDPDDHSIQYHWTYLKEAGNYKGNITFPDPEAAIQVITVPNDIKDSSIHILLEVKDNGSPSLVSYKRVVISAN